MSLAESLPIDALERAKERRLIRSAGAAAESVAAVDRRALRVVAREAKPTLRVIRQRDRAVKAIKRQYRPSDAPLSLDAPAFRDSGGGSKVDYVGQEWADPVGDMVADEIVTTADVLAIVKRAAIVPLDFMAKCREGQFVIFEGEDGPFFMERRPIRFHLLPDTGEQFTGIALMSAGRMGVGSKRKRLQSLASGSRGHGSRKRKDKA